MVSGQMVNSKRQMAGGEMGISMVFRAYFGPPLAPLFFWEISAKKILCPDQDFFGPAISTPIHHAKWPIFGVQLVSL